MAAPETNPDIASCIADEVESELLVNNGNADIFSLEPIPLSLWLLAALPFVGTDTMAIIVADDFDKNESLDILESSTRSFSVNVTGESLERSFVNPLFCGISSI
eukprot:548204_1